jgi:competence protein ComEA
MKEWLSQYLVFSRKERLGLAVLLFLIGAVWLLPEFFGRSKKEDQALFRQADSLRLALADSSAGPGNGVLKIHTLFRFDPNTLDNAGWEKLGVRPKTIGIIKNYLARGGRFRQAEDLGRIYGLRPDESMRLMPYVDIPANENPGKYRPEYNGDPVVPYRSQSNDRDYKSGHYQDQFNYRGYQSSRYPADREKKYNRKKELQPFDINLADTGTLVELPGIGSKLAARIVQFREKLGGFYKIEQVAEIYGLQDTIYLLIRPYLLLNEISLRKIPVNSAGFDTLNAHPYIQFAEARAIVQYRKQHGVFLSLDDLLKISILNAEWLAKVGPYLEIDHGTAVRE